MVVFKLRFNHPNREESRMLNVRHIRYIITRPNVVLNEGKKFGAFGNIKNMDTVNDIQKTVSLNSKKGITMYKAVISLSEDMALKKGYDKRADWEKLLKRQAKNIAKETGIKLENFEYVGAVHMENGHPHMHVCFWDKAQDIQRADVPEGRLTNIRKHLNKDIFKDEINILYMEDKKNLESFKDEMKNSLLELEEIFGLDKEEYKKYKKILQAIDEDCNVGKIPVTNITNIDEILRDVYSLKGKINKKGRLSYAFMTDESKIDIDEISKKLIENSTDLKSSVYKYKQSKMDITKFHSKDEKVLEKAEDYIQKEVYKMLGNQVLNIYKKINSKEWDIRKEEYQEMKEIYAKEQIKDSILNLVNDFTRKTNKNNNTMNLRKNKNKDLSNVAKREIAKKSENKSKIDWEVER